MSNKTVFSHFRYLFLILLSVNLLIALGNDALAQIRLDNPESLARARKFGIEKISRSSDSTQIWIGSRPQLNASLVFRLEPEFDPQKNNLLVITMRTGPRIHNFGLFWKQIGGEEFSLPQRIYRDGEFHTYLISLGIRHSWRQSISELGLRWNGTHELLEIEKLELREMRFGDRLRYYWSSFWVPQILNPAMINALGGPILLDQPLVLLLSILCVFLITIFYFFRPPRGWRKTGQSGPDLYYRARTWTQPLLLTVMLLWVANDLREAYDHIQTLKPEFRYYINSQDQPRHHLELDDFYDFLEHVQDVVPSSSEIGFFSVRPLFVKARYFLFPRRVIEKSSNLHYIVIFQNPGLTFRDGKLMEGETIIGDRLKLMGRFGEDAFILERTND